MTSWQEVKLDDICKMNTETYSLDENWKYVNYLDTGNITSNKIENIQYIDLSVDKLPSRARRKVKNGNIVYSTVRPNQLHYGLIKEQPDNFLVSTGFAVLDIDTTKAIPEYVYYLLTQASYTEALHAIAEQSTSAYPSIKPSDIGNRKISLPPLEIQKKIAGVLSALDDKIELNNKINNNLEQQAQALYVNNIELYKERNIKVEDIVITANTGADAIQKAPIVDYDTGVKCVRVGDMSNKRSYSDWGYAKVTDDVFSQYQLKKDDIIVTRTASLGLNTIISKNLDAVYNNGLIRLTINKDVIVPLLVYRQFQTDDFKNYISKIEGETSVRPNMKINYLLQYSFAVMNKEKQKELINVLEPLWNKQEQLIEENTRLAAIRDALLPKLMNGEIDVSNVDISALTSTDKLSFTED